MIIKSISEFTSGGSLQVNDQFVIARGGLNYYLTGQSLIDATSVDLTSIQTDIALLQSDRLKLDGTNSPMLGDLSLGNNKITNLATPTLGTDAANKSYIDTNFLQLIGGTLTGFLTLNSNPVNPLHAATKQYVDAQLSAVGSIPVDTNDLPEGTDGSAVGGGAEVDGNRYYFTNQRFNNNFSSKTTDNLAEGSINKYFTTTRFNSNFSAKTTDNLLEGSINLYYTDARVRAAISVVAPLTYDSVTGIIGLDEASLKPTFGTSNQIPFMNAVNDDFDYSVNLIFDGNNLALGALINSNYKLNIESSTGTIGLRSVITSNGAIGINAENTGSGTGINTGIQGSATNSSVLNIGVRGDAASVVAGDNVGGYFYANAGAGNYAVQLVDGTETLTGGKFLKDSGSGKANWANIYLADIIDYAPPIINTIYTADDTLSGNRTITGANNELLFQTMGKFSVHSHANNTDNVVFEVRSDATYHGFIVQDHNTGVHMLACRNGAVEISDAYFLPSTDGTSGQVMKTDGLGNVTWQNESTGISGSGQLDRLARWTPNGSTLGYSIIEDDGTTLGINVSPDANNTLRISSSLQFTQYNINSYSGGSNASALQLSTQGINSGTNYGIVAVATGSTLANVGGSFIANGTNPYSVRLSDGTQQTGRFLKCVQSDGRANWADITEADVTDLGTYAKVGTYTDTRIPRWNSTTNTLESGSIRDNGLGNIGLDGTAPSPGTVLFASTSKQVGLHISSSSTTSIVTGAAFQLYGLSTASTTTINGVVTNIGNGYGVANSNIGYLSSLTGTFTGVTNKQYGVYSVVSIDSSSDNVGGYFEASNGGSGNAYSLKLVDGLQAAGKVLTSDSNGNASWQTPSATASSLSSVLAVGNTTGFNWIDVQTNFGLRNLQGGLIERTYSFDPDALIMETTDGTNSGEISLGNDGIFQVKSTNQIFFDQYWASAGTTFKVRGSNAGGFEGIQYDADYSANYINRSLVDKEYVDTAISTNIDTKTNKLITENVQTGTSYTLVLSDADKLVTMDNASANTLNIPDRSSVAFPIGTQILVMQRGSGQTTIQAASGASVLIGAFGNVSTLAGPWATVTLIKRNEIGSIDEWVVIGNLG